MDIEAVLKALLDGTLSIESATERLSRVSPGTDLGYAKPDFHRRYRRGFGEVVYCPGKTDDQLLGIVQAFLFEGQPVLGSRCTSEQYVYLLAHGIQASYDPCSRLLVAGQGGDSAPRIGHVAVCTGGTADLPVAEEAAQTATFFGASVQCHYDVGIAGLHRLLDRIAVIREANVVVAVAGMEGALPGVIAGLVEVPVIAVPTSVGYGTALGGITALLTMLSSCAEGVSVVNIDNGFGAGYQAAQINRLAERNRK